MSLSLIIPARNEAKSLLALLPRIFALGLADEVLVVDDGSSDDTAAVAKAAGARVVANPYRMGNGAAIKHGARHAQGDILLFMDADGQHDPADIPRLLARLEEGFDMVIGARGFASQANLGRGVANSIYNGLASYMTGQQVEDLTSGFRAVRAEKFRQFLYLLPNGFSYPTTITMAFFRAGYAVSYLPIVAGKREGKSHIQPIKDGVRFLLIIFRVGTLYSPLKLFAPVSLGFFLLALGYFFTTWRFTNMGAVLFTTSILVFLIGLVSEQITALMYKDE
jgi:glycosyltransferase involved in cell wall biosynthesis